MDVKQFLLEGNKRPNPEYNPNTKKGASQPPFLVDYTPNNTIVDKIANSVARNIIAGTNTIDTKKYNKYAKDEVFINSQTNEEDLNYELWKNQSWMQQLGRFAIQAGIGEIVLGIPEGFGNIFDGARHLFTGNDYTKSPWTLYFENKKEELKENYEIYRRDPNKAFDVTDFGWWAGNAVSVFSTASLLIPAAGYVKGLSLIGKGLKVGKLSNITARGISKGLTRATKNANPNKFGMLRNMAGKASRIENTINTGTALGLQAAISRTGENFMESKAVYDDVYESALDNIKGMIKEEPEEFNKLISRHDEFKNEDGSAKSPEEIATIIARESADKTFYGDYAMLLTDMLQLKLLGGLWGKQATRAASARQVIAAENVRRTFAGESAEKLLKDNIINRIKEGGKYILKHPLKYTGSFELMEGVEEMWQGTFSEKGYEVATKYFDENFTPRTINSYLSDGHIWEQGLWGIIGGMGYKAFHDALTQGGKKLEALYNKKHMTADEYESWSKSNERVAIEHLKGVNARAEEFITNMEHLSNRENPFEYVIDEYGKKILKDGRVQYEEVDPKQAELLKAEAIDKFIRDVTFDSIDAGTFDLLTEILNSKEFDKYLDSNNKLITSSDRALAEEIKSRMNDIAAIYESELTNVNRMADTTNPYIERITARQITRNRLAVEELNNQINNLTNRINDLNTSNTSYNEYADKVAANTIREKIKLLKNRIENIKKKEISTDAKNAYIRELNNDIKGLYNYLGIVQYDGSKEIEENIKELEQAITERLKLYNNLLKKNPNIKPPKSIQNLIKERAAIISKREITNAKIPISEAEYNNVYDDFARSMDQVIQNKIDDSIKSIERYLRNSENLEEAIDKLMTGTAENKKINEAMAFLEYGYTGSRSPGRFTAQFRINKEVSELITNLRNEVTSGENLADEARRNGVVIPTVTETTTEEKQEEDKANEEIPVSTGEEVEEDEENLPVVDTTSDETDNGIIIIPSPVGITPTEESTPTVTTAQLGDINPDEKPEMSAFEGVPNELEKERPTEQELADAAIIAETYDNNKIKAGLAINAYVTAASNTAQGKMEQIANSAVNGNVQPLNNFIEEIVSSLTKEGFDEKILREIVVNEFHKTVNMLSLMANKPAFYKLATALARGYTQEAANKYSATELIDGAALDEVVDEFLDLYSDLVGVIKTKNGISVINLESLFDYILNNENIDKSIAAHIYNNLFKYVSKHDGSKYLFTGYNESRYLSSNKFFEILEQNKTQELAYAENVHVSPIEPDKRNAEYRAALIAAHNGAPVELVPFRNQYGELVRIDIVVKHNYNNENVSTTIGGLRTVNTNSDLSKFSPISHYSGFKNKITKRSDEDYSLDCDSFFDELINATDPNALKLLETIIDYRIAVHQLTQQNRVGELSDEEYASKLAALISEDAAKDVLNNPLIKTLVDNVLYKFYDATDEGDVRRALKFINTVANILFYGHKFDNADGTFKSVNDLSTDKTTMRSRYSAWKKAVYTNYMHTYELQKGLAENRNVNFEVKTGYYTSINYISDKDQFNKVADLPFNPGNNKKGMPITPLVMINETGSVVDQNGQQIGFAPEGLGQYSMGFVVSTENNVNHVVYLRQAVTLQRKKDNPDEDILGAIQREIGNLLHRHFNNQPGDNHNDEFDEIAKRLINLLGGKGLFRFGKYSIQKGKQGNGIYIKERVKVDGKYEDRTIMTLFSKATTRNNLLEDAHIVKIQNINGNVIGTYNSPNAPGAREAINNVIVKITSEVTINKSEKAFNGRSDTVFNQESGNFVVTLGGKTFTYANYGDFLVKTNGFLVDVQYTKNGGFITRTLNEERITLDMSVKEKLDERPENHEVRNLLFGEEDSKIKDKNGEIIPNNKVKSVATKDVLTTAGVGEDQIKILTEEVGGIKLLVDRIYPGISNDAEANAFYNKNSRRVHVTKKGASMMGGNPRETVRLLLHENLHRVFDKKGTYSKEEKERILTELQEVYTYVIDSLNQDFRSGNINEKFYHSAIRALTKATSSNDAQRNMEEFLVECLTQSALTEYLNNTEYKKTVNINGIIQRKKSIFQKIIDIILKLFGINSGNIKNNSILAKEYLILSKGLKTTEANVEVFADNIISDNVVFDDTSSPVKVDTSTDISLSFVKQEIDNVISTFNNRIQRDANFDKNHTYVIDGQPADYSVTQKIHGTQDIGLYETPSTTLGNSIDNAARTYFMFDGMLPDDYEMSNVDNSVRESIFGVDDNNTLARVVKDLDKIKAYLDNKFGKGNYGVITEEFAIGGQIEVNGEIKTIAGTMDMLVYTKSGDIYIYDFKTKRIGNGDGSFDETSLNGYSQQLNIYRQLLEENFPSLKGRIKIGGLIKFNTDYPAPTEGLYRKNPNNVNQLQVQEIEGYVNIEDSSVDYTAPTIFEDVITENTIIPVEENDYGDKISALPDIENQGEVTEKERQEQFDVFENLDEVDADENFVKTEEIINDNITTTETYATPIADGITESVYGVQIVNDINEFVNTFPMQYREQIKLLLDENDLNYTCQ